jgi:ATP phosphoribosyltransferase
MKYVLASFVSVCFFYSTGVWANELEAIKKKQAQLEQMLKQLQQAEQERHTQNQALNRLQHQLECNWQLIQAYEACESKYSTDPEAHLVCSTKAKAETQRCMEK